jgi:hypothetical protein
MAPEQRLGLHPWQIKIEPFATGPKWYQWWYAQVFKQHQIKPETILAMQAKRKTISSGVAIAPQ